ncbi:MAG: bifunctional folylpolyglutamate synthase/dihydrofolate synthase [Clostridia bacterium]|nr:bifunctional folylpolyglutamate synthase/dihydrofolate synthase [Clostridia bacterium]
MNYTEARAYVDSTEKFGIKPGLERITKMMTYLGNPQDKLRFIHVAGTNGKGSTCTMLASILTGAGYRTGLFTSPFVIDFRERFMVDGEMISEEEFAGLMTKVRTVNDLLEKSGCSLTQFELITAVAFLWFAQKECDVVVLECGLGGRLDSTNVIKEPLCSVITKISLDHTDILGDTVHKIATEKAGIIKPGCPVVLAPNQNQAAVSVIEKKCAELGSPLIVSGMDTVTVRTMLPTMTEAVYGGLRFMVPLAGPHQVENAVTVINTARELNEYGLKLPDDKIVAGIAKAKIPARFDIISHNPLVVVDGAHNPDGIAALCGSIDALLGGRSIVGIIGMLRDKAYEAALSEIVPRFDMVLTVTPDSPRGLSAKELAVCAEQFAREDVTVKPVDSLKKAASIALDMTDETAAIVVCGSLYLASAMLPVLREMIESRKD